MPDTSSFSASGLSASSFGSIADLTSSAADLTDPRQLRQAQETGEAAEQFEAYLFTFMAKSLRSTVPDGLFGSEAMQTFGDLFDQEIGKRVGEGRLLGLADQLEHAMLAQGLDPGAAGAAGHAARPGAPIWGGHRSGGTSPWGRPDDDGLSPTFGVDGRLTVRGHVQPVGRGRHANLRVRAADPRRAMAVVHKVRRVLADASASRRFRQPPRG